MIRDTNLTIMVKDMDRSIAFYESTGFMLKNRWGSYYAQISAPGMVIGLYTGGQTSSGNVSIGFSTDYLQPAKTLLQSPAIEATERNEEGGQVLHFADPDATALYISKPKK